MEKVIKDIVYFGIGLVKTVKKELTDQYDEIKNVGENADDFISNRIKDSLERIFNQNDRKTDNVIDAAKKFTKTAKKVSKTLSPDRIAEEIIKTVNIVNDNLGSFLNVIFPSQKPTDQEKQNKDNNPETEQALDPKISPLQ